MFIKKISIISLAAIAILTSLTPASAAVTPDSPLIARGVSVGAYAPPSPYSGGLESIQALETKLGRRMDIVNWFKQWGDGSGNFTYDQYGTLGQLQNADNNGRTPMITWMPLTAGDTLTSTVYTPTRIINGEYDDYIVSWADGMKTYNKPVYMRLAHEMNGNWYPWSNEGGAQYVAMWKHIVDVFRIEGVTNVKWVWAVNQIDAPSTNDLEAYWPGSDYVDILGTDVYNCGYRGWQSFKDLISESYNRLVALDNTKPVWVAELGTCEPSADVANSAGKTKAGWFVDLFNTRGLPNLEAVVLFNENTRMDWTITTNPGNAPTIRNILTNMPDWVAPPQGTILGKQVDTPTGINMQRTYGKTKLAWNASPNANGYVIKRDGDILAYTQTPTFEDINLTYNKTYTYSIASSGGGNTSSYTNNITSKPNDLYLQPSTSGTSVYLKFNSTIGQTYKVQQDDATVATITATASSTSYTINRLIPNTTYAYQIVQQGTTNVSDKRWITTAPKSPTVASDGKNYPTQNLISWNSISGAVSYKLYRNGVFIKLLPASQTSYSDNGLSSSTSYTYSVRSMNSVGNMSFPSNSLKLWTTPWQPTNVNASETTSGIKISWTAAPNVTGYAIYRNNETLSIKRVDQTVTSFTDTAASNGNSYTYYVRAYSDASGVLRWSIPSENTQVLNF